MKYKNIIKIKDKTIVGLVNPKLIIEGKLLDDS